MRCRIDSHVISPIYPTNILLRQPSGPADQADRLPETPRAAILPADTETWQARRAPERSGPATYQDVLDSPPHMVAEIVAGNLHTQPRPAARHAWASSVMGVEGR